MRGFQRDLARPGFPPLAVDAARWYIPCNLSPPPEDPDHEHHRHFCRPPPPAIRGLISGVLFAGILAALALLPGKAQAQTVIFANSSATVTEGNALMLGVSLQRSARVPNQTGTCTASAGATNPASPADLRADASATAGLAAFPEVTTPAFAADTLLPSNQNCVFYTLDDGINEQHETLTVTLRASGATENVGARNTATVTITDNDDITSVTVADASAVTEGDSTDFTVTLDHASAGVVTVAWTASVTGGSMGGTPEPASGMLEIPALSTTADITISIPPNADLDTGDTRTLTVTLGAVTIAAPGRGTYTTDNDTGTATVNYITAAHTISIADATVNEGAATITVTRTGPALTTPATITWTVMAGTATAEDFTGGVLPSGTVTFAGSSMSETITVPIADDALSEAAENFTIALTADDATLASNMGIQLGADATITITDNDEISAASMTLRGPASLNEGQSAEFTVDLGAEVTGSAVTVMIADSLAPTGLTASEHYTLSTTSITIAIGSRSGTFILTTTNGGGDGSPDRTLTLTATATGGANTAAMAAVSRTISITEDDPAAREARLEAPLASAGRGIGQLAAAAVAGRLAASVSGAAGANSLTIAGRDMSAGAEVLAAQFLASGYATGDREISADELLRGSGFNLAGGDGGRGFNFWGGGDFVSAEGKHDGVDYDGDTSAFTLGIDTGWKDGLVGVAVSRSDGDVDFTVKADNTEHTLETEVTSFHPYLTRRLNRSQLWLTAGHGSGDAEIKEPNDVVIKTDITVTTAAFGITHARGDLFTGGISALYSRAKLDAVTTGRRLPATAADSLRIKADAETGWTHGAWRPFMSFALRHDSGDGDTGGAFDLGGGVEYRTPVVYVRLAGSGHIQGQGAAEQRATLTIRKSTGDFDLGLNLATDGDGVDTGRLLTGEWRF